MNPEIRKFVLLNPSMLKAFGFHGLELAAYAFEIQAYQKGYVCIEAVKRDKSGHFFKDDGATCPHRKGGKSKQTGGRKQKYGNLAEKLVRAPDAMKRINNPTGETITASDGKPAIFNEKSVKHVVGDHSPQDGRRRMEELYFAQDTTATGLSFESVNKGKPKPNLSKNTIRGRRKNIFIRQEGVNPILFIRGTKYQAGNLKKKERKLPNDNFLLHRQRRSLPSDGRLGCNESPKSN